MSRPTIKDLINLVVYVIPTENELNIDQLSSVEEIMNCKESRQYQLGQFFKAMNDEEIDDNSHWVFLIDITTKEEFNNIDFY